MPQSLNQKVTNTFIKGLITEAGELTFPPDASVDELNCQLDRDGSRRRREGINFESDSVSSTFTVGDTEVVNTGTWFNVAGTPNKEFLVVHVHDKIYFYDKNRTTLFISTDKQTLIILLVVQPILTKVL